MVHNSISLSTVTEIMKSIDAYQKLANMLPQLSKDESLAKFCTNDGKDPLWWKSSKLKDWERVDIHIVDQLWGSTSCGWGGIGGSAMSNKYNIVIENRWHKAYYVFWDGRLAYILKNDESINLGNLPSYRSSNIPHLITKGVG